MGGYMYTYDWFMLRFDRKQWNSVKQLFFNKKKEHKRNYDADKYNCNENLTGGAQHIWTKEKKKELANLKISLLRCVIACSREQCISLRSLNSQPSPTFFFKVTQPCPTLCDSIDYTVHGILQARILKWVSFPFFRGSSRPRDQTQVFHIAGRLFTSWATREAPKYSSG